MNILRLTYGDKSFKEIDSFLKKNKNEKYTLSVFDMLTNTTAEIQCRLDEILNVLCYVTDMEHDYPAWIGTNPLTNSYVVGLNFTRGRIRTGANYEWKNNKLIPFIG